MIMRKVLFITVMMMSVFCFSQSRYDNPNSYGNIRYQAESFEERAYVPLMMAKNKAEADKRHQANQKYLYELKKWILELKPQMSSSKHIETLNGIYNALTKVEDDYMPDYEYYKAFQKAENLIREVISDYNTWVQNENNFNYDTWEKEKEGSIVGKFIKVKEDTIIWDVPDMPKAISKLKIYKGWEVYVMEKTNDTFYKVTYGNVVGYVTKSMLIQ